jgi:DUF4097 and DUF4098 domain-containing protein YvlB
MLTAVALLVTLAGPGPAQQPQTDETVAVTRGSRLTVNNFAGDVVIRTWDKDSLHVVARHQTRTTVSIQSRPGGVVVSANGTMGPAGSVDYEISAPAWMPIKVEGTYAFITVEGAQAEVSAQSVRGDIRIKGGSAFVTAKSVEGSVTVEDAKGKIVVNTVDQGIRMTGCGGDITATTVDGPVQMSGMTASSVDASTVDGTVSYQGSIADGGRYRFTSHDGGVLLDIPDNANATVSVRTYEGSYRSSIPALQPPNRADVRRGKRVTMTMGNGSADVEAESFDGEIRIGPGVANRGSNDH